MTASSDLGTRRGMNLGPSPLNLPSRFWAGAAAQARLQRQPPCRPPGPRVVAEGRTRTTDRRRASSSSRVTRRVHPVLPVSRRGHRPSLARRQPRSDHPAPASGAGPAPVRCPRHKSGTQRVPLHVPADDAEVTVLLNRKALEPSLVQRSSPGRVMVRVPTLGVRHRQPAHILRQFSILARPQNKVPMVRHEAVCQQTGAGPLLGLKQHLFERLVISFFAEDASPAHRPVQDVINDSARCYPKRLAMGNKLPGTHPTSICAPSMQMKVLPFLSSSPNGDRLASARTKFTTRNGATLLTPARLGGLQCRSVDMFFSSLTYSRAMRTRLAAIERRPSRVVG